MLGVGLIIFALSVCRDKASVVLGRVAECDVAAAARHAR
jgi:hypothetical protein